MNVKQLGEELAAKRATLADLFVGYPDIPAARVEEIQQLNTEITDIAKKHEEAVALEKVHQENEAALKAQEAARRQPAQGSRLPTPPAAAPATQVKTFGEQLRESKSYEAFRNGQTKTATIFFDDAAEFKTLMTLSTYNNPATREAGIRPYAEETRSILDLIPTGNTNNNTISYMTEGAYTNAAAAVAEGAVKPESALSFTEATESVRKVATWIPATEELLNDVPMMESYVRGRLTFFVERQEEAQVLSGSGVAPNLLGFLNRTGIQTQAKGTDPTPDAVYKAMTKVRNVAFAEPTGAIFHPNDWQEIRLLRTADGLYIWGGPIDQGPDRIWGLNVRQTTAMTEGTALIGDFQAHSQLYRRQGVEITVSTEHSTFFVENKVAILAESRLALAVYRPAAFVTVTGI